MLRAFDSSHAAAVNALEIHAGVQGLELEVG